MSSRSYRVTSAVVVSSGSVGPGTYATDRHITGKEPNFAAFASSNDRKLNSNTNTSANTPGPGSYVYATDIPRKSVTNNCFKTSTARLAPPHPGSTPFCSSSVVDNPGPGQYSTIALIKSPSHLRRFKHRGKSAASRVASLTAMRFNPPTIPRKEQSYGYQITDLGGALPLPVPREATGAAYLDSVRVLSLPRPGIQWTRSGYGRACIL